MVPTKKIGKEGELRFASEFIRNGWDLFMPLNEDTPVDLLICKGKIYKRVQVKTTKPSNGKIIAKIRSTNNWQNKKYTQKDIDIIALYDYKNKVGYLIDISDCEGKSELTLRTKPAKNNQKLKIRTHNDYVYFK